MKLLNKNTVSTLFTRIERGIDVNLPPVTVLAYHAVSREKTIVDIDIDMFSQQLMIVKGMCQFITLDQVINYINGKEKFSKPAVAITFDDGYLDVFTHALPILAKESIQATVFVMSDIHNVNRQELENNKNLMSVNQLHILHNMGWTIGSHSATHANFADPTVDFQKEIVSSKEWLEQTLGFSIPFFAYPKGIYSQQVVDIVKHAEYSAAFAFESGFISQKTNHFAIPRMPVDWTHTEEQFSAFFTHWGVWYLQTKQKFERNFHVS